LAHDDGKLLQDLFAWLQRTRVDMTLFFRALSRLVTAATAPADLPQSIVATFYRAPESDERADGTAWLQRWWRRTRLEPREPAELAAAMDRVNPRFVLRNWLAQEAIDAAHAGDVGKVLRLLDVMARPFDDQPQHADLAQKRPDWARDKPGCSALSCSS
jgi:uncharacterized protein YdiU (UPF0061 family)